MRDILRNIPKKRCRYGAIAFLAAAGISIAAAIAFLKSPQPALAAIWFMLASFEVILSGLLLRKAKSA